MSSWSDAAQQALSSWHDRSAAAAIRAEEERIDRLTLDVTVNGRREMVSLRLMDGGLKWVCSSGDSFGPHVAAALRWLVEREASRDELDSEVGSGRGSQPPGSVRKLETTDHIAAADRLALASALEDAVTAIVRVGLAEDAPAVEDTLQRLVEAAPEPLPLGVSRWIGRLRSALAVGDVDGLARLLDGACRLSEDLRAGHPNPEARARLISWLGALPDDVSSTMRVSDRRMVEVAREWVTGTRTVAVERRYLLDVKSGEMYREERGRGRQTASVGPCPRYINVDLAEIELGVEPRRIRLLQYSVSANVWKDSWTDIAMWASNRFDVLADMYREAIRAFPGLAEPFAIISVRHYVRNGHVVPVDETQRPLPLALADDPGVGHYVDSQLEAGQPEWIAGRLIDAKGTLMLRPLSLGVSQGEMQMHFRI